MPGQMLRRLALDSRQDLSTEQMRHVKSLHWYFLLLTGNCPRLDADMSDF